MNAGYCWYTRSVPGRWNEGNNIFTFLSLILSQTSRGWFSLITNLHLNDNILWFIFVLDLPFGSFIASWRTVKGIHSVICLPHDTPTTAYFFSFIFFFFLALVSGQGETLTSNLFNRCQWFLLSLLFVALKARREHAMYRRELLSTCWSISSSEESLQMSVACKACFTPALG